MGSETVLFKSEEKKSRTEAADFLRHLADKVESGSVVLRSGDAEQTLDIPEALTLEVKAEEEGGRSVKYSLEVELEWSPGGADASGVELG